MTRGDESTKACDGGCTWVVLDTFSAEFDELEQKDVVAFEFLIQTMEEAERGGIGAESYRAPVGLARSLAVRLTRPWLGELKAGGKEGRRGKYRQYRLYFGEAPRDEQSLVACLLGSKSSDDPPSKWRPMQDRHIGTAMDRLLAWCRQSRATCRMLGKR